MEVHKHHVVNEVDEAGDANNTETEQDFELDIEPDSECGESQSEDL